MRETGRAAVESLLPQKESHRNVQKHGLRWLRGSKYLLLFQKLEFDSQHPRGRSQLPTNPVPGDLTLSSEACAGTKQAHGTAHTCRTHTCRKTPRHKNEVIKKIKSSKTKKSESCGLKGCSRGGFNITLYHHCLKRRSLKEKFTYQ